MNTKIMTVMVVAMMMVVPLCAIAGSEQHDASTTTNPLFGMGDNNYSQQGNGGTSVKVTTPTQVGSYSSVTQVACSGGTTLFIDSGKLYGTGFNNYGQQGDGTTTTVKTPKQVGSYSNVTQVVCSSNTTFFIDSGKLYGIGYNQFGQIGNGTTTDVTTPTQVGSYSNVTQVVCSSNTTFFIDSGKLYGMGFNYCGQIGNGTTTDVTTPTQVGSYSNVTQVVCTEYTTFFIDSGKLYGMGFNSSGQIGNGTTTDVTTPTQVGSYSSVTDVACSQAYPDGTTFFIDSGKLYGMGSNDYGQQGNGTTTDVTTPTQVGSYSNVTQVVCSYNATFFINSGKLYGMGNNSNGQQGNGTTTNVTTPTQVGSYSNVTQVVYSSNATFFIDSGKLYGMGYNNYGQQGNGTTTNVTTPTQVGSYSNVTQVVCSYLTTFFMASVTTYDVTISSSDTGYGTIDESSITGVEYGSAITIGTDTLTLNGTTVTATATTDTDQYDYGFSGWYNGSTKIVTGDTVTGDMTITAKFTRDVIAYEITWLSYTGSTLGTTSVDYGSNPTYTAPSRTGYLFTGWEDVDTGTVYADTLPAVTGTATYQATYAVAYTAKLIYNSNGGSGAPETQTYTGTSTSDHTFTISYTEPYRNLMYFAGWSTSQTATAATYQGGDSITVAYNGTTTLYAVWLTPNFTVNYSTASGGPQMNSQYYYSATDQTHAFTIPTKDLDWYGHDFTGWSTTADGDASLYPGDTVTVDADGSVTLYAVYDLDEDGGVVQNLLSVVPLMIAVGLILGIVGMYLYRRE